MKKHKHKSKTHKKQKQRDWINWYAIAILVIVALLLFLNSQDDPVENEDSIVHEQPNEGDVIVIDVPEEVPETEEDEPVEEPVDIPEVEEPETEPEDATPEQSTIEQELAYCTELCVDGDVNNDFKRRECSAECNAVYEHYGQEALDKLIAGLQR